MNLSKIALKLSCLAIAGLLAGTNVYAEGEAESAVSMVTAAEASISEESVGKTSIPELTEKPQESAEETVQSEKNPTEKSQAEEKSAEGEKLPITTESNAEVSAEKNEILKSANGPATPEDYFTFDPSTGTITNFHPKEKIEKLVIPEQIGGVEVKHISWWLGQDMTDDTRLIKKLVLPPTLESIRGTGVFRTFQNLETIEGLDYVSYIGPQAFDKSQKLQYSLTENTKLTELEMYVFHTNLFRTPTESTTVLPRNIVKYGMGAVQGTRARELVFGDQTHTFADYVLYKTRSHNIGLPTTLTTTGKNVFQHSPVRTLIMYSGSNTRILDESEYSALFGQITKAESNYSQERTNVVIVDSIVNVDETDITTEVGKTLRAKTDLAAEVQPGLTSLEGPEKGTTKSIEIREFDRNRLGEFYFTEKERSIYLKNFTKEYTLSSDNPAVVKIEGDSLIPIGEGIAKITIRSVWNPMKSKEVRITVNAAPVVPSAPASPGTPSAPTSPVRPDTPTESMTEEISTDSLPLAQSENEGYSSTTAIAAEEILQTDVPKAEAKSHSPIRILSVPKTGSREMWRMGYASVFWAIAGMAPAFAIKRKNNKG